jgi:hypothetical protein
MDVLKVKHISEQILLYCKRNEQINSTVFSSFQPINIVYSLTHVPLKRNVRPKLMYD